MSGRKDQLAFLFQTATRHRHHRHVRSDDYRCTNHCPSNHCPSNYAISSTNNHRQRISTTSLPANTGRSILPPPTILFSNHHLVVVNKPAGWHSIPLDDDDDYHNDTGTTTSKTFFNNYNNNSKCLLSFLRRHQHGGGGNRRYLKPVHRLDQPCTGVVIMAKNTKAASRIQQAFAQRQVQKEYLCIVHGNNNVLHDLRHRSWSQNQFHDIRLAMTLDGTIQQKDPSPSPSPPEWDSSSAGLWNDNDKVRVLAGMFRKRPDGKGSVQVTAITDENSFYLLQKKPSSDLNLHDNNDNDGEDDNTTNSYNKFKRRDARLCFLEYRYICAVPRNTGQEENHHNPSSSSNTIRSDSTNNDNTKSNWHLLAIRTHTEMRHQIRALFSHVGGCPIVGDFRYGGGGGRECYRYNNANDTMTTNMTTTTTTTTTIALLDQSVALHARAIYLPTVQLGGTDLVSKPFVAPIPKTWMTFFGLTEEQVVRNIE
jgi:23S rRNA-/tRNA-specific pseudouridylate synthase